MENHKSLLETLAKSGISGLLIFVIIIFGLKYLEKFSEIQTDLQNIKIELVKVQNKIMDKADIEKLIDDKINLHEVKFHQK